MQVDGENEDRLLYQEEAVFWQDEEGFDPEAPESLYDEEVDSRRGGRRMGGQSAVWASKASHPLSKRPKQANHVVVSLYQNNASGASIDVDMLCANATGNGRIHRLYFIGDHCPDLAIEAYAMASEEIKSRTWDVEKYLNVMSKLKEAVNKAKSSPSTPSHVLSKLPSIPLSVDTEWIEATQKAVKSRTEKLEAELKNYKSNLIKESIRMGHSDLGDHYYHCGDLENALKSYSKTRDYCATPKHIIDHCMSIIKVSLEMGNFANVQNYIAKAEVTPEMPDKEMNKARLDCLMGLSNIELGRYKVAAKNFLDTKLSALQASTVGSATSPSTSIPSYISSPFSDIITPNDVAVYGCLCALASFDRQELKKRVFENSDFKHFLELEPELRECVNYFYSAKYSACLEILERKKTEFYLDPYLNSHVDILFQDIRKKIVIQYFSPFMSVDMNKMAAALNTNVKDLESEVAQLVGENALNARIDSHNKVLQMKSTNQRDSILQKTSKLGQEYTKSMELMMLRMNLIKEDLIVREHEAQ